MHRAARSLAMAALTLLAAGGAALAADETAPANSSGRTAKRGGYSYSADQTINTSGDARGRYGAANSLRDPSIDRQTQFGPFDHGFFYDAGVGPGQHGGVSVYMH